MHACFDEENWFVTFQKSLEGLTPEYAEWKREGNHSIHELVNHMIFWNLRYLHRFKSVPVPEIKSNEYTFTNGSTGHNIEGWNETVKKADEVFTEWIVQLKDADDTKLEGTAIEGHPGSWFDVLSNITIHNAYHIGQIVTIRKQQGSWNSEQGVS